jgi:hypothetical protein
MQLAMNRIISHRLGLSESGQTAERKPGEALAGDGAQVGTAPLHQEGVSHLGRGVAPARLHQPGVLAHEVGEMDQLIERIGTDATGHPAAGPPG